MRQCLYLVGYESEPFEKLWANLLAWLGLWPFIFPEEEFYWHLLMLTKEEAVRYRAELNVAGTPRWSQLPDELKPSRTDFTHGCNMSGVWIVASNMIYGGEECRPGYAVQRLSSPDQLLPPATFWHEMSHALGCDCGGGQADYNTIHFDPLYHCGTSGIVLAGQCPQMDGQVSSRGLCTSTLCVRCRACASRWMGLKTNYRQTLEEHKWFEETFNRPYPCWPYADMNGQMNNISSYDYEKYPLRYWRWDHDLAWYYSRPVENHKGRVRIEMERLIGGDGTPRVVVTAEHPDYVFDPVEISVKEKGFLRVSPDPAIAGSPVQIYAYRLENGQERPIAGVDVWWGSLHIGSTGTDGTLTYTPGA
ncbi:MAG: hypothetical protein JRD89_00755 [Deltaproteobacteria bacterium]|nr:hypothetical protein [Deltaproteobacteria bacterium]